MIEKLVIMKKLSYIASALLLFASVSLFSSCGDNENFWGIHTLTDDELAEMARQDSIKQAQRERIDADLILEYTVEFYMSENSYDGAPVKIDMDAIAQEFGVAQYKVTGSYTYGGHGEAMAVFASKVKVDGKPLAELNLSAERFAEIKHNTIQGGSNIIKLRGRSSFQSPAYQAVKMIEASMGGEKFTWPAGTYVNNAEYKNVMMAMPTVIDATGVHFTNPEGSKEEMADLQASYEHLCKMRDEIVTLGIVPAVADWKKENPNL